MTGKTCLRGVRVVVLASLLLAPPAQASSWWSSLGWSSSGKSPLDGGGVLSALWQRLTVIFQEDDGENRGTIDPNG